MAFDRYDIRGGAVLTTLNADITSGAAALTLTSATGWPDGSVGTGFWMVVDPGLSGEEKIFCTSRSSTTVTLGTRGADGTAASAHSAGAVIQHIASATQFDNDNNATHQTLGLVAAKGDVLTGSTTNTLAKTTVGANNTVLVADSAQTGGVKWATVTSAMITDGTIATADLADGSVTSAKILDGTIVDGDISAHTISNASIAASTITATEILDGTISTTELADSAVTSLKIQDGTITGTDLANNTVTNVQLATAVTAAHEWQSTGAFGGSVDITSVSFTAVTHSDVTITIPTWATKAIVRTNVTGCEGITSGAVIQTQSIIVGGAGGTARTHQVLGNGEDLSPSWSDQFTSLPGTGAQTLRLQAKKVSGGGAMRYVNGNAIVDYTVTYLP